MKNRQSVKKSPTAVKQWVTLIQLAPDLIFVRAIPNQSIT